jgi:hypothetical protein
MGMAESTKLTKAQKGEFARGRDQLLDQIERSKQTIEHSQELIKRINRMLAKDK